MTPHRRNTLAALWAKLAPHTTRAAFWSRRRGDDGLTRSERRRIAAYYQEAACARPTTEERDALRKRIAEARTGRPDAQ